MKNPNFKLIFILLIICIAILPLFSYNNYYNEHQYDRDDPSCKISNLEDDWNILWGGSRDDFCTDMVIDTNNNIYMAGYGASFGINQYDDDAYLVKFNNSGGFQWEAIWGYDGQQDFFFDIFFL
ncbi:MAG: SBBP repeat-containing protein [Promethearchaeota archaeon]